jgi:hypothetical protein
LRGAASEVAEKLDLDFDFWVAQRFAAAINLLFSKAALAAEGRGASN